LPVWIPLELRWDHGPSAKLALSYEMSEGILVVMSKAKVLAWGGGSSWDSLWPSARIPNSSPSQMRFNPDEPDLCEEIP
jgi:hypothetical protein